MHPAKHRALADGVPFLGPAHATPPSRISPVLSTLARRSRAILEPGQRSPSLRTTLDSASGPRAALAHDGPKTRNGWTSTSSLGAVEALTHQPRQGQPMPTRMFGDQAADQLQLLRAELAPAVTHRGQAARRSGSGGEALSGCPAARFQGKKRSASAGTLPRERTGGRVLDQPGTRVDVPQPERPEQAEQRRRQRPTPQRPRAVVVLASHHRAAQGTLGRVVTFAGYPWRRRALLPTLL